MSLCSQAQFYQSTNEVKEFYAALCNAGIQVDQEKSSVGVEYLYPQKLLSTVGDIN
jgi:hypothetical protein